MSWFWIWSSWRSKSASWRRFSLVKRVIWLSWFTINLLCFSNSWLCSFKISSCFCKTSVWSFNFRSLSAIFSLFLSISLILFWINVLWLLRIPPTVFATAYNWLPFIASVLSEDTFPDATLITWRSLPDAPTLVTPLRADPTPAKPE